MITLSHNYLLYCNLQPDHYWLGEGGMLAGAKRLEGSTFMGLAGAWCQCTFMEGGIKNGTAKHVNQRAERLHVLGLDFFSFVQVCLPEFVD